MVDNWISWVVSSIYLDGGYLGLYPLYIYMVDIWGYILYIFRWWISWVISSIYLDGGYFGLYPLYI